MIKMSNQANISESVLEAHWKLQKYWTKVRLTYENKKDFDLVAYNPLLKTLVVGEAKAQSTVNTIYLYHQGFEEEFHDKNSGYCKFISDIRKLWEPGFIFKTSKDFSDNVDNLIIHLVLNVYIQKSEKKRVERSLEKHCRDTNENIPKKLNIEVQIDNFMDIIAEIQNNIKKDEFKQSRMYENTILDFMRELKRYTYPDFKDVGYDRNIKDKVIREYFNDIEKKLNTLFK